MEKIYIADDNARTLTEAMAGHKIAEISKRWYFDIYEGMPPIGRRPCWLEGEVYSHNEQGVPLFQMFFEYKDHYYACDYLPANTDVRKVMSEIVRDYQL